MKIARSILTALTFCILGLYGSEALAQGNTNAGSSISAPAVGGDGKAPFTYTYTSSGMPAGTTCRVTVTVTVDPAGVAPEKEVTTHKPTADPNTLGSGEGTASHPGTAASGDIWTVTVTIKCTRPDGSTSTTTSTNQATTP